MNKNKIDKIKTSKPIKVLDFGIIVAVVAVCIISWVFFLSSPGARVQIWRQGVLLSTESLQQDKRIEFDVLGGDIVIIIQNGKVWVEDVDCNDQVCKKMGKISRVNQVIICSPNNVFLKIVGPSDFDIIT